MEIPTAGVMNFAIGALYLTSLGFWFSEQMSALGGKGMILFFLPPIVSVGVPGFSFLIRGIESGSWAFGVASFAAMLFALMAGYFVAYSCHKSPVDPSLGGPPIQR